jgi:uncharacterized protein DUF6510
VERVDGNAIAGLLTEIFGRDITADVGTCAECGAREEVGATHVYRSAGITLRCPQYDAVLISIVDGGSRIWFAVSGLQTLELNVERT